MGQDLAQDASEETVPAQSNLSYSNKLANGAIKLRSMGQDIAVGQAPPKGPAHHEDPCGNYCGLASRSCGLQSDLYRKLAALNLKWRCYFPWILL